jgi:hypothetical protein
MSTVTITISVHPAAEVAAAPGVIPVEISQLSTVQAPMALEELGAATEAIGPMPMDVVVGAVVEVVAPEPLPLEFLEQAVATPDPISPTAKKATRTRS